MDRGAAAKRAARDRAALERTRDLMDAKTRDCLVTGYHGLIPSLQLPDPDDRHVLAAAICGALRCDRDAEHPGLPGGGACAVWHRFPARGHALLCNHFKLAPGVFLTAVRKVRARLENPPYSTGKYLAIPLPGRGL